MRKHCEDAVTGQINLLYSLRQTKNQGDYWQPLSHSRAAFLHITNMFVIKPLPRFFCLIQSKVLCFALPKQNKYVGSFDSVTLFVPSHHLPSLESLWT